MSEQEERYWSDRETVQCSQCGKVGEARDVHRFKGDICVDCSRHDEAWKNAKDSLLALVHRGDREARRTIRGAFDAGFYTCLEQLSNRSDVPRAEKEGDLAMDAGAGDSDYSHSLIFTSSKFVITAFGHDREHCEDVLQCVLQGRFKDHKGDREFLREKERGAGWRLLSPAGD